MTDATNTPRTRLWAAWAAAGALAVTSIALTAPSRASQLPPAECDKLKAEAAELGRAGVRDQMAKGPAWARANLGSDGLERIRRLIALDEQVGFRCPRPPPPKPVAAVGEDGQPVKAKTKVKAMPKSDDTAAATDGSAAPKPKPKPKPKPVSADPAAPPKAPPPPKTAGSKQDDAFRPRPKPASPE